ncbi:MAG: hypothetical protein N2167_07370 [Flavobacteriales bacterium]|nr:hypothetical protein [Flavobacteriales bacterium]
MMKKIIVFTLSAFTAYLFVFAQNYIPVGGWRTHLPFTRGLSITDDGTRVYCGTMHSLYSYNIQTGDFEKYTKTEGFSGVGISRVQFHAPTQTLVIGYDDSNIDLLKDDVIYNLSQIKNASIQGSKLINNIKSKGDSVIIACDFGVVILDVKNKIIKTDVKFSDDMAFANMRCYDGEFYNGFYYFATSNGIYRVSSNVNMKNLNNWVKLSMFADGHYNNIERYNNKLYLNYSGKLTSGLLNADTLIAFDGTNRYVVTTGNFKMINDLHAENGVLCIVYPDEMRTINQAENTVFSQSGCFTDARQATIDNQGSVWLAENKFGAFKTTASSCNIYVLDGPFTANVYDIEIQDGIIWAAAGGFTSSYQNTFNIEGLYYNRDNDWKRAPVADFGYSTPTQDVVDVIIDPQNPLHVYAACWGTGLLEYNNYQVVSQLVNSPLDISQAPGFEYKIGGLAFDKNNNLWMSNSHTTTPLKVKRNNNTWSAYGFGLNVPTASASVKVSVDALNNVWMSVIGKGILVFNPQTNASRLLTNVFNQGDLPSTIVRVMTPDRNGEMWVGTDDGLRIFSPSQVFSNSNINGQKIVIKAEDGNNELLLGETIITDIEVDGANRKWIATDGNGVRLVSENGREIIYSFTAENSPLLSNKVNCIAIDHATGEVYFGTSLGIVSFRAEATEAGNSFGQVYAFPNPVKPDYNGVITITGMAEKSTVKITDVSGNLVYETESLGGQAVWDGKRFDGKRVQSGVYLVFCANRDASETIVTKILFIN